MSPAQRKIRVGYYALLREAAGKSQEVVTTTADTPRALYAELAERYAFSLAPSQLKVAVNAEFSDWSVPLEDGDAVVFMPPMAGG
jgi:molybdopterin converting factor small subunit